MRAKPLRLVLDRDNPLSRGLVLAVPVAGIAGTMPDLTSRHNGIAVTGATSFSAPSGRALHFNGTSNYAATSRAVALGGVQKLTVAIWAYWNSYANDADLLLESSTSVNSNSGSIAIFPNDGGGAFGCYVGGAGGTYNASTFTRPSAAAWHLIVFQLDTTITAASGQWSVWVDNAAQTMSVVSSTGGNPTLQDFVWYLFSRAGSSLFGAGRWSDLRIWNRHLTSGERRSLYYDTWRLYEPEPAPPVGRAFVPVYATPSLLTESPVFFTPGISIGPPLLVVTPYVPTATAYIGINLTPSLHVESPVFFTPGIKVGPPLLVVTPYVPTPTVSLTFVATATPSLYSPGVDAERVELLDEISLRWTPIDNSGNPLSAILFTMTVDGVSVTPTVTAGPGGAYDVSVPATFLPDHTHTVVATSTTSNGHVNSVTWSFTVRPPYGAGPGSGLLWVVDAGGGYGSGLAWVVPGTERGVNASGMVAVRPSGFDVHHEASGIIAVQPSTEWQDYEPAYGTIIVVVKREKAYPLSMHPAIGGTRSLPLTVNVDTQRVRTGLVESVSVTASRMHPAEALSVQVRRDEQKAVPVSVQVGEEGQRTVPVSLDTDGALVETKVDVLLRSETLAEREGF